MFFRSIRFRLTLWYALSLAVILAASGLFWHIHLAANLLDHIDERLDLIAGDVSDFLEGSSSRPTGQKCSALENFTRQRNWGEYVQILDENGRILCQTGNIVFSLPVTSQALTRSAKGEGTFETVLSPDREQIRVMTFPDIEQGRVVRLIQVGQNLDSMEKTLQDLQLILLVFSPIALLGISLGGWFLAGRALSPMVQITQAAQRIKAENLSLRLPVEHSGDEIAELADTFNSMLARLEDSFRKVRQFSGDASHELRTPLAILRGETEVTLRWAKSAEDYRRALESNLEEIDRMGRIIEDLLTLAKSDAGEMPLEMKSFSLSDLLQELYLQGRTLGESKGIDIQLRLEVAQEIRIRGDELRLRQVFLNLLSNAVKYTPEGGSVEILLGAEFSHAVVTINDTGIGIPEEHLPHIFDRFYRIDQSRNREAGGTGLGLAIVKSIVQAHQGTIEVTSAVGQGSAFTVRLPAAGPGQDQDPVRVSVSR